MGCQHSVGPVMLKQARQISHQVAPMGLAIVTRKAQGVVPTHVASIALPRLP
ncbi:hypothetical protein D3C81_2237200 [compost metagenome]